jgi:hypothetical protein
MVYQRGSGNLLLRARRGKRGIGKLWHIN